MSEITRRELISFQIEDPKLYKRPGIECGFVYNRHDKPLSPRYLQRRDWNGIYLEEPGPWLGNEAVYTSAKASATPFNSWLAEEGKRIGRVYYGDIGIPDELLYKHGITMDALEGIAGIMLIGNYGVSTAIGLELTETVSKALEKNIDKWKITRRKFLVAGGILSANTAAIAWLELPFLSTFAQTLRVKKEDKNIEITTAFNNTVDRLQRISNATHPESMIIFTRNLITAAKLNTIGQYRVQNQQPNEKVAVSFGKGHKGLEDLFMLGPEYCSFLLSCYPRGYFSALTDGFKHTEQFKTTSLVTWDNEKQEWISSERIIDPRLERIITQKQQEPETSQAK